MFALPAVLVFAPLAFAAPDETKAAPNPKDPITVQLDDPSLKAWADTTHATMLKWYPKIRALLGVPKSEPYAQVTLHIVKHGSGVAGTGGTYIEVNGDFVRTHPKDIGLAVHELVHVVQAYPEYNPSWIIEGMADYVRWLKYEPKTARPKVDPKKTKYTKGYGDAALFMEYVTDKYDHRFIKKLHKALRATKYTPDMWKESTHKSLDELWAEYIEHIKAAKKSK